MLRLFTRCNNILHINNTKTVRTFLSEAYKCTEAWKSRLNSPVLQKVHIDELYNTIDQRFSRHDLVSSIDIEIFANAASGNYFNELRDLLYKLRLTLETSNSSESTQYAVIRCFMETKNYKELIDMLDDRLNYGIFVNEFTGNILMDELIKEKDYSSASKIASQFMLQEDFENNEITENLSAFACYKYLSELRPEVVVQAVEEVIVEAPVKKKKKEEEIKIRVRFLRNPYFDDHFDLSDIKQLAGKTLALIPYRSNNSLSLNCQLIGWLFYKKTDKVKEVAKYLCDNKLLLVDSITVIKNSLEHPFIKDDPEVFETYKEILSNLENSDCLEKSDLSMEEKLIKEIKNSLSRSEQKDIQRHSQLFGDWEKIRESSLAEQLSRLENARILQEKQAKIEELRLLDEKIWFFDNEEKFDLKIRKSQEKKVHVSNKKSKDIDENYIPPEVGSRPS